MATEAIGQVTAHRKLSIVARGRTLGASAHMLTDRDATIHSEPGLFMELIAIVAGAAGERLEFDHLSTGVSDDLHAATTLARRMVTSFGMSDLLGPVTIGEAGGEVFLGASLQDLREHGPIDAGPHRPRGRTARRGCRGPGRLDPEPELGVRCTRRLRPCSSTKPSPASPSMP